MARFRYEYPRKVDFEKLEFTHSDRQHFKNLRSTEDLMEEMSASDMKAKSQRAKPLATWLERASQDRGPPRGTRGCTAKFPADHGDRDVSA